MLWREQKPENPGEKPSEQFLLQKLQRLLNCAARLVRHSRKFDHISPIKIELHWLPIEQRFHFKIL